MSAAHQWPWHRLERGNVGSHELLVELAAPQPGERVLDIGTGSGGLALSAARRGADVVGVDVSEPGIERARERAREQGLEARFDVGDAQQLAYDDASFDVVLSAFGINFAPDNARAAAELERVCRRGGRIALALMPRHSRTAETFTILRSYGGEAGAHPAAFADDVQHLLGGAFDLDVRLREVPPEQPAGPQSTWEETVRSFGQLEAVVEQLDTVGEAALREELTAAWDRWEGRPSSYVVVVGTRM